LRTPLTIVTIGYHNAGIRFIIAYARRFCFRLTAASKLEKNDNEKKRQNGRTANEN